MDLRKVVGLIMIGLGLVMVAVSVGWQMYEWIGLWIVVAIFGAILLAPYDEPGIQNESKSGKQETINNLEFKLNQQEVLNKFLSGNIILVGDGKSFQKVSLSQNYKLSNNNTVISNEEHVFYLENLVLKEFIDEKG